ARKSAVQSTRVLRVEDARLLTGRGQYVDDVLSRARHAAFVRSHDAHGRIRSLETRDARAARGVVLVLTATEVDGIVGTFQPLGPPGLAPPAYCALATNKVRFAGEPIAMVVAETRAQAEDACELIHVDIEPLSAATTIDEAGAPDAPTLFDDLGS